MGVIVDEGGRRRFQNEGKVRKRKLNAINKKKNGWNRRGKAA